ncbi:hypothetical protein BGY98DRAFT_37986 [Russula aff. rugulosa BPL654]|nr:hypothetical protein BGY98DRAFT_37986 [Russula aff. rugulosa BPL654]
MSHPRHHYLRDLELPTRFSRFPFPVSFRRREEKNSGDAPALQTRDIPINSDEIASPLGHVWAIFPDSVKLWYWSILLTFSSLERPVILDQDSKSCYYPSKPCRRSRRTYECEVLVGGGRSTWRYSLDSWAMFYLPLCPSRGQVKWQRRIGSHDPSDLFCAISFQTEGAPRKCDRTLFWRPRKPVPRDTTIRVRAGGRRCSVRLRPSQSL